MMVLYHIRWWLWSRYNNDITSLAVHDITGALITSIKLTGFITIIII
jgi:hypothetical protein